MDGKIAYATGGCQCGRIRFRVTEPLGQSVICHCRMCQRATGNVFAPLVNVTGVEFDGAPDRFASSDVADRGFCRDCGTPLFYEGHAGQGLNLMVGALDDPDAAPPVLHCGVESQVAWLHFSDGLSADETKSGGLTGNTPRSIQSHQHPGAAPAAEETR
jgi:hypothetical protein